MGFVGTTRPRDLLFCVDEWLEYRRRLSLVPIRSELKRRRTALSVHDEPGPASPNRLTFKQFRKIRTWKIGLLRHFRTGARGHIIDSREHRARSDVDAFLPASLSVACKGPTGSTQSSPSRDHRQHRGRSSCRCFLKGTFHSVGGGR